MGTLRFFEEVVSFKIRRTFGFADYRCPFEGFSFGFASEAKIYIVFPIRKIIVELHR